MFETRWRSRQGLWGSQRFRLGRLLCFELRRAARRVQEWSLVWIFFLLIVLLFTIGLGAHQQRLSIQQGAGVIWVAVLLAMMLSFERLWRDEWEQGMLAQFRLSLGSLISLVWLKMTVHWVFSGLALLLLLPLALLFLDFPLRLLPLLLLTLSLGTQALSVQVALGSAMTLGLRRAGFLIALLLLPLYLPILIFGMAVFERASLGLPYASTLGLLWVLWGLSLSLLPSVTAKILGWTIEDQALL